jgi:hypothetical protein
MTFTAIPCWSCKERRSVRIRSPRKLKGLITGPAIKQSCWLCRGTGYLNAARFKEYERRKRHLLAVDTEIIARRDTLTFE